MFIARTGVFLEKEFLRKEDNGSKVDLEEVCEKEKQLELPRDEPTVPVQPPVQGAENELVASQEGMDKEGGGDVEATPPPPSPACGSMVDGEPLTPLGVSGSSSFVILS